ncbi:MAG: methylase [Eubacteriales bacterium]|nr:methylase [Eubacteriales bacterium]
MDNIRLTWEIIQANAVKFSKRWEKARNEEAQAQAFEIDFFKVFGIEDPESIGDFEYKVPLDDGHVGYIDYLWKKYIAVEMKSRGKDLGEAYDQLKDYVIHLPAGDMPDLLMVCDFENIVLHRRSTGERFAFKTKELHKHVKRFANIAGYETTRVYENQVEVNVRAAEKMAKLHDALKDHGYEGHDLEVYLVRLLFCLFADDTGIFPSDSFVNYIENSKEDGKDLSDRIGRLFEVLNMSDEARKKRTLLSADLLQFRYINGGLFASLLPSADFDAKMRRILLDCCNFNWNKISPAVFGAMFQGVMDKDQRRELGAHYTSEENILKLINPLFMDELWEEFDRIKSDSVKLDRFHDKISRLKFLDPACGCGNFLIITYRELRLLELEVLKMRINNVNMIIDISPMLKVNVEQFYGIEYEDFPCQIAQAGMWLMDHQMNLRAAEEFGTYYARLPLTQSATIIHGNALQLDWESIVSKYELSYILGNPPFIGYSLQSEEQKADILSVYVDSENRPIKNAGKIDYVAAWYYKAAKLMAGTDIRTAFVSTNSIVQGEQVSAVWRTLYDQFGIHIDFGYRTFIWNNEAKGKAAVHCVIVGFSSNNKESNKVIYENGDIRTKAQNINPYLVDAPDVFIDSRSTALCPSPPMFWGNKPVDGGNLILSKSEYEEMIDRDPSVKKYIRKMYGAEEYINNIERYCLWLIDTAPHEIRELPDVLKRVEACRQFRLDSKKEATRKAADYPSRFMEVRQPDTDYIIVPSVSSERRRYIPIGFLPSEIIVNNAVHIIANATLYHFGVLTSNVHMAWVRAVCGRLKSDYRYSKDIVYNNFPWPEATNEQKTIIEYAAQGVLDARSKFPGSTLADMYDPLTMPKDLLKAHQKLDRAVMLAYGFSVKDTNEAKCVALLMERYRSLSDKSATK